MLTSRSATFLEKRHPASIVISGRWRHLDGVSVWPAISELSKNVTKSTIYSLFHFQLIRCVAIIMLTLGFMTPIAALYLDGSSIFIVRKTTLYIINRGSYMSVLFNLLNELGI